MPADFLIVVVFMMVLGCATLVFGVLYFLCRLLGGAGRCVIRALRPRHRVEPGMLRTPMRKGLVCPREQCRKIEYRSNARFCSRCGSQLR